MTKPERAARNSLLIRGVNERINELSDSWSDEEPHELLCECGDEGCIEGIFVTRGDYEAALRQPGRYLVDSDHGDDPGVTVLMSRDGYSIVEYQENSTG